MKTSQMNARYFIPGASGSIHKIVLSKFVKAIEVEASHATPHHLALAGAGMPGDDLEGPWEARANLPITSESLTH